MRQIPGSVMFSGQKFPGCFDGFAFKVLVYSKFILSCIISWSCECCLLLCC